MTLYLAPWQNVYIQLPLHLHTHQSVNLYKNLNIIVEKRIQNLHESQFFTHLTIIVCLEVIPKLHHKLQPKSNFYPMRPKFTNINWCFYDAFYYFFQNFFGIIYFYVNKTNTLQIFSFKIYIMVVYLTKHTVIVLNGFF